MKCGKSRPPPIHLPPSALLGSGSYSILNIKLLSLMGMVGLCRAESDE